MAFATWPGTVPFKALFETYSEQPEKWVDAFEVEEGPPQETPAISQQTDQVSCEIMLNKTQLDALMAFWRTTLAVGTKRFTAANPEYGGNEDYRFITPPEGKHFVPGYFKVSIRLRRFN